MARELIQFVVIILILAGSTVMISGCSPATKHKVLTFFFTGVPEPGSELAEKDDAKGLHVSNKIAKKKKRRIFYQEPKFFVHGPFAARECGKCHSADSAKQFRIGGAKKATASASKKKRFGPRLAYPLKELCITCHNEKSGDFAKSMNLSVHEPVATGMCTKCHDPHKAVRQYMLEGKNSVDLCTKACHTKDDFLNTVVHRKDKEADCLECHNPHVGKTAQLLRSDFDEWQQFDGAN